MASILLINPPSPPGTIANREGAGGLGVLTTKEEGGFFYPPHTLAWAAGYAHSADYSVAIIDAVGEDIGQEAILRRAVTSTPAYVGVQVSPATASYDLEFLQALNKVLPGTHIIALGHGTQWVEADLTSVADLVLLGEPEGALPAAITALSQSSGPLGKRYPHELGAPGYRFSGHMETLDMLPLPAWELLPYDVYTMFTAYAGRGCEFGCRYCPYIVTQGHAHRPRSAEAVADELQLLHEQFGARRVVFRDPLFAADYTQSMSLCEELNSRGLHKVLTWECETRPEVLFQPLLIAMQEAGCRVIKLGVETANPKALVNINRVRSVAASAYVAHATRVIGYCRELGITCRVFVMAGLPGEGDEGATTADWLAQVAPDAVHVKTLVQYPGTPLTPTPACDATAARLSNISVLRKATKAHLGLFARLRRAIGRSAT